MEMSQNMKYFKKITFILLQIHDNVYINIFSPVSQKFFPNYHFIFSFIHT